MTGRLDRIGWLAVLALLAGVVCALVGAVRSADAFPGDGYSTFAVGRPAYAALFVQPGGWESTAFLLLRSGAIGGAAAALLMLVALIANGRRASHASEPFDPTAPPTAHRATVLGWIGAAILVLALVAVGASLAHVDHAFSRLIRDEVDLTLPLPGRLWLETAIACLSAGWLVVVVRTTLAMIARGAALRAAGAQTTRPPSINDGPPELT